MPWFDWVWQRSKIARNPLRVYMHGYLSNGYLSSLSNFNYEKARKIWSLRPLLDQPWITTKIASNIMKVGMHSYLPNAQINLWSNFNSEKLVKSETPLCCFAKVGLKQVKIFRNAVKVHVQVCLSNGHPNLWANCNSKKLLKSETLSCGFTGVGLKRGQNIGSERYKIWGARLFIQWASKSMIKFPF